MKKILVTVIALLSITMASGQISAFKQGNSVSVEGYSLPRTVISVKITQEREIILRGPYARYASQYLGIATAPMSDKETYRIINAQVSFFEEPDPKQTFAFDDKSGNPARIFNWLSLPIQEPETTIVTNGEEIDLNTPFKTRRMSAIEKSQDQMASEVAELIYRIRRKRIDLITGDVGEGVFGDGLKSALEEMDKVEAECVALFVGKRYTQTITKIINVVPEAGKNRITACRFSDSKGVVPVADVSGRPINLEILGESINNRMAEPTSKKVMRTIVYRIPQMVEAKLTDGQAVLATQRIPVYQSGSAAEVPVVFGL